MLILDLDDTIFETKSMNPRIFDSAISIINDYYEQNDTAVKAKEVIADLWSFPPDVVFAKYKSKAFLVNAFYEAIGRIDYRELDIATFSDYKEIKTIVKRKVLVTTGIKELQLAKINALEIANDFAGIYIDDPRRSPREYKVDIFKQLLFDSELKAHEIWVIGDNPESELKAGRKLGMRTILRSPTGKYTSEFADFRIESFAELKSIVE